MSKRAKAAAAAASAPAPTPAAASTPKRKRNDAPAAVAATAPATATAAPPPAAAHKKRKANPPAPAPTAAGATGIASQLEQEIETLLAPATTDASAAAGTASAVEATDSSAATDTAPAVSAEPVFDRLAAIRLLYERELKRATAEAAAAAAAATAGSAKTPAALASADRLAAVLKTKKYSAAAAAPAPAPAAASPAKPKAKPAASATTAATSPKKAVKPASAAATTSASPTKSPKPKSKPSAAAVAASSSASAARRPVSYRPDKRLHPYDASHHPSLDSTAGGEEPAEDGADDFGLAESGGGGGGDGGGDDSKSRAAKQRDWELSGVQFSSLQPNEYFGSGPSGRGAGAAGRLKNKTSNHTLANLNIISEEERLTLMASLAKTPKHAPEKARLASYYASQYRKWYLQLRAGFNLLFYGLGSKKAILHSFAREWCTDGPVLVVNGYFPAISLKQIFNTLLRDVLDADADDATAASAAAAAAADSKYSKVAAGANSDFHSQFEAISRVMAASGGTPRTVYILFHNMDGLSLRNEATQTMLSMLATLPGVHLIASIDHILSPLLWDSRRTARFQWLWHDITSYADYASEHAYLNPVLGGGTESRIRGLQSVLASLTLKQREILVLLAEEQLKRNDAATADGAGGSGSGVSGKRDGLPESEFRSLCDEKMIQSGDLNAQLKEFIDHGIIRRLQDGGVNYYFVPYPPHIIRSEILTQNDVATGAGPGASAAAATADDW